ncbi:sperm-associated antigen 4 protein isoform X2 [Macrotis lagotis]|uniref:sperm-associated antigen 4 protein isoform X2 n=1 Tax=Macrotis lagotis TaxID=92651 RepID=UPI003D69059A
MRRSPRLGSSTARHKHNPGFCSDGGSSSVSAGSPDAGGRRGKRRAEAGPKRGSEPCAPQLDGAGGPRLGAGEREGARAGAGSGGRGPGQRRLVPPAAPSPRTPLSCLGPPDSDAPGFSVCPPHTPGLALRGLGLLPALFGEALGVLCSRGVRSLRFQLPVLLVFSVFTTVVWGAFLYFAPVGNEEVKVFLTLSEYHDKLQAQGLQLQHLQSEFDKLHTDIASIRAANSERVAQLVFQRLSEDFVQKPDYALSSVGASIDLDKTSDDYESKDAVYFWKWFSFWSFANPPSIILQPDVFPGNCWAFQGSKGQVVIRLPGRVHLSDITFQYPPQSVAHNGDASSAPKDFAVYGLQGDDKTEILLGKFTFDVHKSEIQTFHLKNEPPEAFPKVKIEILSNWGQSRFTCLYRVRAHGLHSHHIQGEDSRTKGEIKGEPATSIPH